jgi:hypothetical protein
MWKHYTTVSRKNCNYYVHVILFQRYWLSKSEYAWRLSGLLSVDLRCRSSTKYEDSFRRPQKDDPQCKSGTAQRKRRRKTLTKDNVVQGTSKGRMLGRHQWKIQPTPQGKQPKEFTGSPLDWKSQSGFTDVLLGYNESKAGPPKEGSTPLQNLKKKMHREEPRPPATSARIE